MQKEYVIKLGERSWTITAPLKFRQLAIVEPSMSVIIGMKAKGETSSLKFYDEVANVILAVLAPLDPAFSREKLDDLPVTPKDLTEAMQIIARAAGMWKEKDPKLGEDQPVETPAPEAKK